MRKFETGATRDTDEGKPDYAGYLSPLVIERYGQYMLKHQKQADGTMRSSDNWKKGISKDVYMSSMFRHFMAVWKKHELGSNVDEDLCALMFNVMGYLYEELKTPVKKKEPISKWHDVDGYYMHEPGEPTDIKMGKEGIKELLKDRVQASEETSHEHNNFIGGEDIVNRNYFYFGSNAGSYVGALKVPEETPHKQKVDAIYDWVTSVVNDKGTWRTFYEQNTGRHIEDEKLMED